MRKCLDFFDHHFTFIQQSEIRKFDETKRKFSEVTQVEKVHVIKQQVDRWKAKA